MQCGCGGKLVVKETTDEARIKYGVLDDYWLGCSRYRNKNPCRFTYTIKDLSAAVEDAITYVR